MKISVVLAGAVLMGGVLTGCGGSDGGGGGTGGDYCDDLKAASTKFDALESSDFSALEDAFDTFEELADAAPDEVAADWAKLDGVIGELTDALEEAGIEFSDMAKIASGEIPEGVDISKLTALATTFQDFSGDELEAATANISKHAKDSCGVTLPE